ncbi:hypothetical protein ACQJBY_050719 [Aegilops geniculata]
MCLKSIHIRSDFSFLGTITTLASHSEWYISRMNSAARNRATSSPMAFLFSVADRRRYSLTGFTFGSTRKRCSANPLGTPGMSDGFHAKMSQFSRRNWMSASSYLLLSIDEIWVGTALGSAR